MRPRRAWRQVGVAVALRPRWGLGRPRLLGCLETSRLWNMFEGRSKAALANRLRALSDDASAIEAVVIDPFAPYRAAVRELLPHAVHVADRFHIERLANTALTDTRCRGGCSRNASKNSPP